ncbi:hypothetical protein [Deinococcus yavapaiensis]|uniref:Uncharacterized protein n=1 Tax=Deinococcus yavapaiensis KR-236 TaxID=694435 RepID=A0A318SF89_9DEIO|nr:hypothetical protein [Deinococcus yavapaiensis]PYE52049.1 hypothetical protein DES52_11395 [Deinococcus yavapaiensis KR-236]
MLGALREASLVESFELVGRGASARWRVQLAKPNADLVRLLRQRGMSAAAAERLAQDQPALIRPMLTRFAQIAAEYDARGKTMRNKAGFIRNMFEKPDDFQVTRGETNALPALANEPLTPSPAEPTHTAPEVNVERRLWFMLEACTSKAEREELRRLVDGGEVMLAQLYARLKMEKGSKAPDPNARLRAVVRTALDEARGT